MIVVVARGRVEKDEAWETAAFREVLVETEYEVAIDDVAGLYERPDMGDVKRVYRGHVIGGAPALRPPETVRVAWHPIRSLPANRIPGHLLYVEDALRSGESPVYGVLVQSLGQRLAMRTIFGLARFRVGRAWSRHRLSRNRRCMRNRGHSIANGPGESDNSRTDAGGKSVHSAEGQRPAWR